jgi:hypothetical protein
MLRSERYCGSAAEHKTCKSTRMIELVTDATDLA